jgi:hypothetical protein
MSKYDNLATAYAEHYGIVDYKTNNNKMIYYVSYPQYLNNKHYTIKCIVNLNTMQESRETLKRYNGKGVCNV